MTTYAKEEIAQIPNHKSRAAIERKIEALEGSVRFNPLGRWLRTFTGYVRVKAAGRYRVVYTFADGGVQVVHVGLRQQGSPNDVYRTLDRAIASMTSGVVA